MNRSKLFTVSTAFLLLLIFAASPASTSDANGAAKAAAPPTEESIQKAESSASQPSATQRDLAEQLVDAVNAKNAPKLKALIAPKSLACFDKSRQPYLDKWIERQFRSPIDKDYKTTVAKTATNFAADAEQATFPVVPTHVLIISGIGGSKSRILHRLIAEQDGKWLIVLGCPTKETLDNFTQSEQVKAKANERADKLMPQVKEPLAAEVRALVNKGDRMGATKLCALKLHTDLLAARVVVERISAGEGR